MMKFWEKYWGRLFQIAMVIVLAMLTFTIVKDAMRMEQ